METIGQLIYEYRIEKGLTQDQFGKVYQISGPAVFKFEKGFVKPSLELWIKIAKDIPLTERMAVLIWIKDRLPENYQDIIQISGSEEDLAKKAAKKPEYKTNFSKITDRNELKKKILKNKSVPEGLKKFIDDEELWVIYKPQGEEIDFLVEHFGHFKKGGINQFREVLRLYREFKESV